MSVSVSSPFFHFTLNPQKSSWSLYDIHVDGPSLEGVGMVVSYQRRISSRFSFGKARFHLANHWKNVHISDAQQIPSPHGSLIQLVVDFDPDINGIQTRLGFFLSQEKPLFFWNLRLENQGDQPIEIERIEMLRAGSPPERNSTLMASLFPSLGKTRTKAKGTVRPNQNLGKLGFFSNGWQSWSRSGSYTAEQKLRSSKLGFFANQIWYQDGKNPPKQRGVFTSDMFGIITDLKNRTGILAGFLSQRENFGSLDASIADHFSPYLCLSADGDLARLDPGSNLQTDWAVIQFINLDDPQPLDEYLQAVASQQALSSAMIQAKPFVGWCSWYQFFGDIDEQKITRNLNSAETLRQTIPLSIIQLDDGFQSLVGDWYDFKDGFPHGVAPLAEAMREADFTPGLWLAPFILHAKARIRKSHPDWILRNRYGFPVDAGFLWNSFTKALDLSHPDALHHVTDLIHTAVHDWGFRYLKLDFLYAAALRGRYHDQTKTRAQVLRNALEAVREAAGPDTVLLGCGVPLGSSIGIFNAVRIGADVAPNWEPRLFPPNIVFRREPNLPSARNALQNILSRSIFHHQWWVNDPDCLLVRSTSSLTLAEVQTLATAIAITGGSLFFSDDLPKLSPDRMRIAQIILPLIDRRPRVLDWFDSSTPSLVQLELENQTGKWYLSALFNWTPHSCDRVYSSKRLNLPPMGYFAREFWSGEFYQFFEDQLYISNIPAHGVRLVALTPISGIDQRNRKNPLYLGSNLHISQGLEVRNWSVSPSGKVCMKLERPGKFQGVFDLYLPNAPKRVSMDGGEVQWKQSKEDLYQFQISSDQSATIEIE